MTNLLKICLVFALICPTLHAEGPNPATPATDPFLAPRGYLLDKESWVFSKEKALETRNKLIDLEFLEKKVNSLENNLQLEKENGKFYLETNKILQDQNFKNAQALHSANRMNDWERIGWFGLGVLATVLAAYGIKQATK